MTAKYKIQEEGWLDTENNMFIPNAPGNRHYQEVQQWLAAGNTPDPQHTQSELNQQAKGVKIAKIDANFKSAQKQPVTCTVNGKTYQMDGDEQATVRMDRGIRFAEQVGTTTLDIVDFNNRVHKAVPLDDCKQIRLMQAQFYYNLYMTRAHARDAILA